MQECKNAGMQECGGRTTSRRDAFRIVAFLHFCILAFLFLGATSHAEVIDRVLAIVGGRPILLSDVVAARDLGLVSAGTEPDVVGTILDHLIDRALMLTEVERFVPPEPAQTAVDARVDEVRARFPTPDAFRMALARSGIDEAQLRETVREDLRIQAYLDLRFTVPAPSDEDVQRYFTDHVQAFAVDGRTPELAEVRSRVVEVMTDARRLSLVNDWVAGLRRRADIVNLYRAGGAGGSGGSGGSGGAGP
jgi:hypothetical protein